MRHYAIRGGEAGKPRLDLIAETLHTSTLKLLEEAGVAAGYRCLDVGCGAGHVAMELGRVVGPGGSVTGVDIDAEVLGIARQYTAASGLDNAVFEYEDARKLVTRGYDLVYARFLLGHVNEPRKVMRRMADALRPGGVLVVEDSDHDGVFCQPPSKAYARYHEAYTALIRSRGGDPTIGVQLATLARRAHLEVAGFHVTQPAYMNGPAKSIHYVTLENIMASAAHDGVLQRTEAERLLFDMHAFADDDTTVVSWPRIMQMWARRSPHSRRRRQSG